MHHGPKRGGGRDESRRHPRSEDDDGHGERHWDVRVGAGGFLDECNVVWMLLRAFPREISPMSLTGTISGKHGISNVIYMSMSMS